MNQLLNKNILITAGSAWTRLDTVRVITNIFGGRLGYTIAKEASKYTKNVLLLIGNTGICFEPDEPFKIKRFIYYDDIFSILKEEVSSKKYDILIHSAAIPDYKPKHIFGGKIKSGKTNLKMEFEPTEKIIDYVKKWDPNIFLVKFKLEVGTNKTELIKRAYQSMLFSNADLIVANKFSFGRNKKHVAYIIDKNKKVYTSVGKELIASDLIKHINKCL